MNTRFNLLPWRNRLREQQKKTFIGVTVGVVLVTFAILGLNYYVEQSYIDAQQQGAQILRNKISSYEKARSEVEKLEKMISDVNKQITTIEDLRLSRQKLFIGLENIAQAVPDSVFLTSISINNGNLIVKGIAKNETGVSEFFRQLQNINGISNLFLQQIREAHSTNRFSVPENSQVKSFVITSRFN